MSKTDKINYINKALNLNLTDNQISKLLEWHENFINYNLHTNLMSKTDVDYIFEKHVFDSLSLNLWNGFSGINSILDVGTGGGFPSVILAICFPDKKILANDSRIKKINFINQVKNELKLDNLEAIYSRIELVEPLNVDLIVSRAVGKMLDVYNLSKKHLSFGGKFIIYKSKLAREEMEIFKKQYKDAKFEIINYKLPLEENFDRNLIILN